MLLHVAVRCRLFLSISFSCALFHSVAARCCLLLPGFPSEVRTNPRQKLMKKNHQTSNGAGDTNPSEVWLDKQDILQRMNISDRTLLKWRRQCLLPYSRVGGKIYYLESDLLEMLKRAKVEEGRGGRVRREATFPKHSV